MFDLLQVCIHSLALDVFGGCRAETHGRMKSVSAYTLHHFDWNRDCMGYYMTDTQVVHVRCVALKPRIIVFGDTRLIPAVVAHKSP